MPRQYQSHSEMGRTKSTASKGTSSNSERNINTSTKQGKKRNKHEKVFSMKFVSMTLLLAIIMFFICFTVGVVFGPDLPL